MGRSIEEIQRELEELDWTRRDDRQKYQREEQKLQELDEQEREMFRMVLAPLEDETRRIMEGVKSSVEVMKEDIQQATADVKDAVSRFRSIDSFEINKAARSLYYLAEFAEPEKRDKLLKALDKAYEERKRMLEQAYQTEKEEYDRQIEEKKKTAEGLEEKIRGMKVKLVIRKTVILAVVLFILSFSIRWGTIIRNRISEPELVEQTEITEEISQEEYVETEEADAPWFVQWLFPAGRQ